MESVLIERTLSNFTSLSSSAEEHDELFARWQQTTLIVIPYISGPISFVSSSLITFLIVRDWKYRQQFLYHRFLLAMSLCDIVGSINASLSGIAIPKDYDDRFASNFGTVATCEMSGFLMQFSAALPLMNMFLCLYYMRVVCFGWIPPTATRRYDRPHQKLPWQLSCFEWTAYGVSIAYPLAMGAVGLYFDSFNPMETLPGWCYFSELPIDCNKFDDVDCLRGENYASVQTFACTLPLGCAVILGSGSVSMVSAKVRRQHNLMAKRYGAIRSQINDSNHDLNHPSDTNQGCSDLDPRTATASSSFFMVISDRFSRNPMQNHPRAGRVGSHNNKDHDNLQQQRRNSTCMAGNGDDRLKQTALQAKLYVTAFLITYVVPISQAITGAFLEATSKNRTFFFVTGLLITILTPLQGFWNLLIYVQPRYRRLRRQFPDKTSWQVFMCTLFKKQDGITGHVKGQRNQQQNSSNERNYCCLFRGRQSHQSSQENQQQPHDQNGNLSDNAILSSRNHSSKPNIHNKVTIQSQNALATRNGDKTPNARDPTPENKDPWSTDVAPREEVSKVEQHDHVYWGGTERFRDPSEFEIIFVFDSSRPSSLHSCSMASTSSWAPYNEEVEHNDYDSDGCTVQQGSVKEERAATNSSNNGDVERATCQEEGSGRIGTGYDTTAGTNRPAKSASLGVTWATDTSTVHA